MIDINSKSLLLFILFNCCFCALFAQQLPQYTQFVINPYLVNPAIAGTEDFIHLQAGYRSQWSGFEGAPETAYFSGHSTLNNGSIAQQKSRHISGSRVSMGMILTNDKTGPLEQSTGALTFAYNFPLNAQGLRLSFGLNAGMKRFAYDPAGYTDHILHQDDPAIQQLISKSLLNFSAGFWLYDKNFFAGASSFQLFNMDYSDQDFALEITSGNVFLRHYNAMLGFNVNMGEGLNLVPSVLLKMVAGAPISYDLNAKFVVADQYWLGGSYRRDDSFAFFGGLLINNRIELSYSFDMVFSKIRTAAAGSNEIHLGYRLFHGDRVNCPKSFW